MKKLIALLLSVLLIMSSLGIAASASSIVGCDPPPPQRPCPTTEAPTEAPTTIVNVTQNVYVIEAESDPTTVMGFLYRIIKTLVPYIYKLLSLLSITVSFNGQCTCGCQNCCDGNHCADCQNNNNGGNEIVVPDIVIPSIVVPSGDNGDAEEPTTINGDSTDGGSVLSQLFKDLFSGSGSES